MSDPEPPQISVLDARLAEIDKRLRTIQTGLVTEPAHAQRAPLTRATGGEFTHAPAGELPHPTAGELTDPAAGELPPRVKVPEPGSVATGLHAVAGPAESLSDTMDELRELAAAHADLLDSMRVLLSGYELALAQARSAPLAAAPFASPPAPAAAPEALHAVTVAAGPFANTEAVRGFERALAGLAGVQDVEVRGYERGNRAILDVHFSGATS